MQFSSLHVSIQFTTKNLKNLFSCKSVMKQILLLARHTPGGKSQSNEQSDTDLTKTIMIMMGGEGRKESNVYSKVSVYMLDFGGEVKRWKKEIKTH